MRYSGRFGTRLLGAVAGSCLSMGVQALGNITYEFGGTLTRADPDANSTFPFDSSVGVGEPFRGTVEMDPVDMDPNDDTLGSYGVVEWTLEVGNYLFRYTPMGSPRMATVPNDQIGIYAFELSGPDYTESPDEVTGSSSTDDSFLELSNTAAFTVIAESLDENIIPTDQLLEFLDTSGPFSEFSGMEFVSSATATGIPEPQGFSLEGSIDFLRASNGVREVSIDIDPRSESNEINLRSGGFFQVDVITTGGFDASEVNPATVTLQPDGESINVDRARLADSDRDGDVDIILTFRIQDAELRCGTNKTASLTGVTNSGMQFQGSDRYSAPCVKIVR